MKAKDYLSNIIQYDRRIRNKEREIEGLQQKVEALATIASGVTAIRYDVSKVVSSGLNNTESKMIKVSDAMDELELAIEELTDIIFNYQKVRARIIDEIEKLDEDNEKNIYSELLYCKYVNNMSLEEIAVDMNYSYPYIKHAHGWALAKFQKKYLNDKHDTQ